MYKKIVLPAIILTVICAVTTMLLALTYVNTKDVIAQREKSDAEAIRRQVIALAQRFDEKKLTFEGKEHTYFEGFDESGKTLGYVFTTSAKGYGGDVPVMTGISPDGLIIGVIVLANNETPGMGKKTENPSFSNQFKIMVPEGSFKVVKKSASGANEIDAVTGATISSTAVTKAVNTAVTLYTQIKGAK